MLEKFKEEISWTRMKYCQGGNFLKNSHLEGRGRSKNYFKIYGYLRVVGCDGRWKWLRIMW